MAEIGADPGEEGYARGQYTFSEEAPPENYADVEMHSEMPAGWSSDCFPSWTTGMWNTDSLITIVGDGSSPEKKKITTTSYFGFRLEGIAPCWTSGSNFLGLRWCGSSLFAGDKGVTGE
ncbi:hypothetical protein L1887_30937 [Cichorium endivia]|nr:hypothetical protein L1887_30937 [Cichorium endivia]